jgi:hypothetical protein
MTSDVLNAPSSGARVYYDPLSYAAYDHPYYGSRQLLADQGVFAGKPCALVEPA